MPPQRTGLVRHPVSHFELDGVFHFWQDSEGSCRRREIKRRTGSFRSHPGICPVLGLTLFLIYINDLNDNIKFSQPVCR